MRPLGAGYVRESVLNMDEGKRFLRLVVPGLTFILEGILLLLIADRGLLESWFCVAGGIDALGTIAGVFLTSGGVGGVLSVIHHWIASRSSKYGMDFRPVLEAARSRKHLKLTWYVTGEETEAALTLNGAWRMANVIWHATSEAKDFDRAQSRVDSLSDLAHGIGAAFIGTIAAPVCVAVTLLLARWGDLDLEPGSWPVRLLLFFAISGGAICVYCLSYRAVRDHCVGFVASAVAGHLSPPNAMRDLCAFSGDVKPSLRSCALTKSLPPVTGSE